MVSYDLQFDFFELLLGLGPKNRNYSSNLRKDVKVLKEENFFTAK